MTRMLDDIAQDWDRMAITKLTRRLQGAVAGEMIRARELHGEQKHLPLLNADAGDYAVLSTLARNDCEDSKTRGTQSWDEIMLEEVFEFLEAIQSGDKEAAMVEGIQALAMLTSMVEILEEQMGCAE